MPTKTEFTNRVLLIMNEAGLFDSQGSSFTGADSAQVDRYIEGTFVDAWRRCANVLPKSWFKNASFKHYPLVMDKANGTGYVILPNDFYLLNAFKMEGWKKPVFEASVENERTSSIQSNEYTRGSVIRPVCITTSKEFDLIPSMIFIGEKPILNVTPFDEVFYCSLNNTVYAWVDDTFSYKGRYIETQTYNHLDLVFVNNQLHYCTQPGVTGEFNISKWSILSHATNQNEIPILNHNYVDSATGNIYVYRYIAPIGNKFELLDTQVGINQALSYYSLPKGLTTHTIESALYIPSAKPLSSYGADEDLGIDQRIVEPLAYLSASTVFSIFEKYDISKALELRVVEMFPGFKSQKGTNITIKQ